MANRTEAEEQFRRAQDVALAATGIAVTSTFIDVRAPSLRVHVLEAGAGDPVLMIHGGNSVAASWAPLLAWLAPHHRLMMPDRPGCGLTTMFDYRRVDLRSHGASFVRGVFEALELRQTAIVANSMGGFFAMAFAIANPQMVSKLVLMGEPAGADGHPRLFHRLVGTRGLNAALYATALRPAPNAAGARAGLERSRLVAEPSRVDNALLDCLAAAAQLPGATRSWRTMVEQAFVPPGLGMLARKMTVTHALLPELGQLTAPTLFLWGDKDPLSTPDAGRTLADSMPNARLHVVKNAGHLPWLDQPVYCGQAASAFLAE